MRILHELEEAGAFVMSLDASRSWFRYHRLFADLLRVEVRRPAPGEVAGVHAAAGEWYARHGYPVEAIRHAQAAQDWALAARLLSDHFLGLYLDGQGATAHDLLAGFPAGTVTADAELAAVMAADEVVRGSLEAAERCLALATNQAAGVPADRRGRFQVELALLRLLLAQRRGDLPAVVEQAQPLLAPAGDPDAAQPGQGEDLRALALVSLGAAELSAVQAAAAERHLEQGAALARRIGRPWLEVTAMAHLAWAAVFRSQTLGAQRSSQAIELARRHGWTGEPVVAVAYAVLGAVLVWQLRLEEAESPLEQAERTLRADAAPSAGVLLYQARGMLEMARGRDQEALAAFRLADRLAGLLVTKHPRLMPPRAYIVRLLVRVGETGRAEAVLAKLDPAERESGEMRTALAALRLAQHRPQAATAALAPVLDGSAVAASPRIWLILAFMLEAIAPDALGDAAAAGRAIEHALDLAEPEALLFPFLLYPAPGLLD